MPRAGFDLAIPATKQPQTYALDLVGTGIGTFLIQRNDNSDHVLNVTWRPGSVMSFDNPFVVASMTSQYMQATKNLDKYNWLS
jgi:hypothetical protein